MISQGANKGVEKSSCDVWAKGPLPFEQRKDIRRLSWANLGGEISDALNINRGFVYTCIGLTLRPAETIRAYLQEGRYRVLNPAKYFFLVLGLLLFVASACGYFDTQNLVEFEIGEEEGEILTDFGNAFQTYFVKYFSVWSLGFSAVTSFLTWLFFRKGRYNYIEHLVLNTYTLLHPYWLFLIALLIGNPVAQHGESIYFICYCALLTVILKILSGKGWLTVGLRTLTALSVALVLMTIVAFGLILLYLESQMPLSP